MILSWAILMRGYTGSDVIVFRVGSNQTVTVDFGNDNVREDAAADAPIDESARQTSIRFTKASPHGTVACRFNKKLTTMTGYAGKTCRS